MLVVCPIIIMPSEIVTFSIMLLYRTFFPSAKDKHDRHSLLFTIVCGMESHGDRGLSLLLEGATGQLNIQSPLQIVVVRQVKVHVGEDGSHLLAVLLVQLSEDGREREMEREREGGGRKGRG